MFSEKKSKAQKHDAMLRSGFSSETRSVTVPRFGFFQDSRIRVKKAMKILGFTMFMTKIRDKIQMLYLGERHLMCTSLFRFLSIEFHSLLRNGFGFRYMNLYHIFGRAVQIKEPISLELLLSKHFFVFS